MKPEFTYLDHAATTPVAAEVLLAMQPYFGERFGNPSSRHGLGVAAQAAVDEARRELAAAVAGAPGSVVFTGGGTEADVLALRGAVAGSARPRHLVVSAIEHPAVLATARALERQGHRLTVIPVDRAGCVDVEAFAAAVEPDTAVAALMAVNNELGTVEPVAEVSRRVKERAPRALFHVDAVQAFGRLPVDFRDWPHVDTIAMSAHKIYGPKGTGALFARDPARLEPVLTGGGQEAGLRSGTHNVPGIVGLAAACRLALERRAADLAHYAALDRQLLALVGERFPRAAVNGPAASLDPESAGFASEARSGGGRVPYILNLRLPELPSEPLLNALEGAGFYVSSGSACHAKSGALSPVLAALGLSDADGGNLRVSIGRSTTADDVARFAATLASLAPRLGTAARRA
jgi:cysteine desulfurase